MNIDDIFNDKNNSTGNIQYDNFIIIDRNDDKIMMDFVSKAG